MDHTEYETLKKIEQHLSLMSEMLYIITKKKAPEEFEDKNKKSG